MDAEFTAAADAILQQGDDRRAARSRRRRDGERPDRRLSMQARPACGASASPQPMTPDSVFALFSCTKAVTGTAVLQLVEEGRLDLDAPAKRYVPEIGALQVLEGFDEPGALRLRPPKRDITTRMLMLHTAGFGYPYFSATLERLAAEHGQPDPRLGDEARADAAAPVRSGRAAGNTGSASTGAGQVVEAVVGERLDAILEDARVRAARHGRQRASRSTPAMRARRASMHQREPRRRASRRSTSNSPATPEVFMGGGALFGTVWRLHALSAACG